MKKSTKQTLKKLTALILVIALFLSFAYSLVYVIMDLLMRAKFITAHRKSDLIQPGRIRTDIPPTSHLRMPDSCSFL